MQQMLASFGLSLDIVGVILLFFWGPPMHEMQGSVGRALESGTSLRDGRTVADEEMEQLKRHKTHSIIKPIPIVKTKNRAV